ncbi:unnamed protein product [Pneumocystis jirovecii]|uniref:Uncharacterized protein n=1 Tax=Pneumocystis jirovecii TaxID=42068 RepID=L0PBP0_PNEJI|nr:unnamed protein product [Pneumocystis jirovecii]
MRRKMRSKTAVRRGPRPIRQISSLPTSSTIPPIAPRKRGRPSKKPPVPITTPPPPSGAHVITETAHIPPTETHLHHPVYPTGSWTHTTDALGHSLAIPPTITPITVQNTATTTPPRRSRGLSVNLVVGESGIARVVQSEPSETELQQTHKIQATKYAQDTDEAIYAPIYASLDKKNEIYAHPHGTSGTSDTQHGTYVLNTPLGTPLNERTWTGGRSGNDCLAFVTSRQGFVRVEALHGRWSPGLVDFGVQLSPESLWGSSGEEATDDENIMDARVAMKRLVERRRTVGLGLDECLGEVWNTPSFQAGKRQRRLCCKACHMTFRQFWVLQAHEKKCNVKQTPFLSSDYFDDTVEDCIPYFHEDTRSEYSISSPMLAESLSRHLDTPRKSTA